MNCPKCQANWKQYKAGFNPSGSQRYRCGECQCVYTPQAKQHGYPEATCLLTIHMYVESSSYGSIGRVLKVNPQSVATWVSHYTAKLPKAPMPPKVRKAELDELYTFLGKKKRNLRSDYRGSRYTLYLKLGCCDRKNLGSLASLPRACASSKTILQ